MADDPITLAIGPWLPDLPALGNPGCTQARNVYPKTSKGYGPWPSPMPYSGALDARCQGGAAFIDKLGNVSMFAGDAGKLYRLISGSVGWVDVSRGGGYATPQDGQWNFSYANGLAIATNYNDAIQSFDLASSSTFADLSPDAPRARYAAIVKNFLVLAGTYDPIDADQPQRVWWPALNDPTNWPTPGTTAAAIVQSSFDDLLGDNGFCTGIVGNLGNADGAVFMERAVFRMIYSGPPEVFDFPPAEGVQGCVAPNSIVQYGNVAYYVAADGPYYFDGLESAPIALDQWAQTFLGDLDQGYLDRVVGAVDPVNHLILWAYPGQGNVNGNPNHLIVYNVRLKRGSILDVECETVLRLLSIGYTLDELYTVLGYSLDTLPAPLDSRVWTGGLQLLGTFDTLHKLNYFTGANLAATVETMEVQPFVGRRTKFTGARPLVDGGTPSIAVIKRELQQSNPVATAPVAMNGLGLCPVRGSGRYVRGRIAMPAGSDFSQIQGLQLIATPGGDR
ncbi:hypothetical protein [uncultured Devosia sp.]|uniref:hypothetical protein n=1 Tax=uncultured Devosia sp. TaxID=211434 RepID=UPI00262FD7D9|nr:hypothetical protein [uncultured Devosia sp.]